MTVAISTGNDTNISETIWEAYYVHLAQQQLYEPRPMSPLV